MTGKSIRGVLWAAMTAGLATVTASAAMKDAPHPFIMWTKEEAAALKQRIDTDPVAKKQYERMATTPISKGNPTLWNLFNYSVMGDQAAGAREKAALLQFIGRVPEPMTEAFKVKLAAKIKEVGGDYDKIWTRGNSSVSDSHQRDEQTLNTLRYDVLYDLLSPEERAGVETAMKAYIQFHLDGAKPRHPDFHYTRMGWLPNMHWPRPIGTHLMAVALKDPKLIDAMFKSEGGWKWYFDDYITDGRFYNEEFNKFYSNIGSMTMYCEALERLALSEYGYGYVGKGGATMRKFMQMKIYCGFPRIDQVGGMPGYPCVSMGDAGDAWVIAPLPAGAKMRPDRTWWSDAHMNGPLPKMQEPFWYEYAQRRWPEDRCDYFLARLRLPGDDLYLPTLYSGLEPIDPKKTTGPEAKSFVTLERGFAVLRTEESPAYWESPKPAVALQFGKYYVHYVHDCFSILNYVAFNRIIYQRLGIVKSGYAGGDPWRNHVAGHASGVVVDNLRAQYVDDGNNGCANEQIRQHLSGPAKFVAVRAKGIYPDVDQERILVLSDEYLLDTFWLLSDKPRVYDWHVMAAGDVKDPAPAQWTKAEQERPVLSNQLQCVVGDKAWSAMIQHATAPELAGGVRVSMLPDAATTLLKGIPPGLKPDEAGIKLIACRTVPSTTFVALHEPYQGDGSRHPVSTYERIQQTASAVGVRIAGEDFSDRVIVATGDGAGKPQTIAGDDESFTFTDFGWIRVTAEQVDTAGNVTAMKLKVAGKPKLVVNGKAETASVSKGILTYEAK